MFVPRKNRNTEQPTQIFQPQQQPKHAAEAPTEELSLVDIAKHKIHKPVWSHRRCKYRDDYGIIREVIGLQVIQANSSGVLLIENGESMAVTHKPWHVVTDLKFHPEDTIYRV